MVDETGGEDILGATVTNHLHHCDDVFQMHPA